MGARPTTKPRETNNKQGGRNSTLPMTKSKMTRKRPNLKKFATHKGEQAQQDDQCQGGAEPAQLP